LKFNRAIVIIGGCALLVASAFARPDLNAFLNKKVDTTSELVTQAKRDPQVMDRYMRHFGMSRSEVLDYLASLHPDTIKETGVYAIYSVPEGGKIKMHIQKLEKGNKIFASNDGIPQLILLCGNPLSLGPKHVVALNKTPVTTEVNYADEIPPEVVTDVNTDFEPVAMVEPAPYALVTTSTPPIPILSSGGGFNPLPLALGGLGFINRGGSSPTPEPMTMIAFGTGIAFLVKKRRKAAK